MIAYQITLVRVDYFQTLFCNMQNFPANSKFSAAATFLAYSQAFIVPPLPFSPSWWDVRREWREAYRTALMTHFDLLLLSIYWRWIRNSLCWKSSLKVVHLSWGQFFDHHGMLYIISNLLKVAIWRSKDFRIRPLIAEKSTTLLFNGTLGHTVLLGNIRQIASLKHHVVGFHGGFLATLFPYWFWRCVICNRWNHRLHRRPIDRNPIRANI